MDIYNLVKASREYEGRPGGPEGNIDRSVGCIHQDGPCSAINVGRALFPQPMSIG